MLYLLGIQLETEVAIWSLLWLLTIVVVKGARLVEEFIASGRTEIR